MMVAITTAMAKHLLIGIIFRLLEVADSVGCLAGGV